MTINSIFRELRGRTHCGGGGGRGRSHIAPDGHGSLLLVLDPNHHSQWANLPPELLMDVIHRLETSQATWPARRDVVVCASVCKSWRDITSQIVTTPEESGNITFPISLKQPGPRQSPIQCFVKRDRPTSTFQLYLGLSSASLVENGKLLLSAKKVRKTTCTEFVISLGASDFSRGSHTYMGKLRSNFLGTKFTIYDRQAPRDIAAQSSCHPCRRLQSKQGFPRVSSGNCNIGTISYELNMLRARGPRKMQCNMHTIPISAIQEGGTAPTPTTFPQSFEEQLSLPSVPKLKQPHVDLSSTALLEPLLPPVQAANEPLTLKNKSPRWHEQLQCWCLNFRGRVTVASVKNFQLVASVEPLHHVAQAEQERVILQFGKIGKDIFTMDYCYPLSAFQAFAICLSSFDTKPACE